jgi:succinoglycan biosynthesis protein ExoM
MRSLISICVCTYRRSSLADTLESLKAQRLPDGTSAEIVVIDNDEKASAWATVRGASSSSFPISYVVEPRKGLSVARNRALELARGSWLALIDDDEIATPGWLFQMFTCARRFGADAVIGSVFPKFAAPAPQWLVNSPFYDRLLPPTGSRLGMAHAHTASALLRAEFVRSNGLRFDETFNVTGGEDSDFFLHFIEKRGLIVSCCEAVVYEHIPPERMTAEYVVQRCLATGEIYAHVRKRHGNALTALSVAARAIVNIGAAAGLFAISTPLGKNVFYRFYVLLLRNLGKLRYFIIRRPIKMYK